MSAQFLQNQLEADLANYAANLGLDDMDWAADEAGKVAEVDDSDTPYVDD